MTEKTRPTPFNSEDEEEILRSTQFNGEADKLVEEFEMEGFGQSCNFIKCGDMVVEANSDSIDFYASPRVYGLKDIVAFSFVVNEDEEIGVFGLTKPPVIKYTKSYRPMTWSSQYGAVNFDDYFKGGQTEEVPASMESLLNLSHVEQLKASGFEIEGERDNSNNTAQNEPMLLSLKSENGKTLLLAYVKEGKLNNIFRPVDTSSLDRISPEPIEIIGRSQEETSMNGLTDGVNNGLRVRKGWLEFTISGRSFSSHYVHTSEPKIIRMPTIEELAIETKAEIQDINGFVQYGNNSTETIEKLTTINGISISGIESIMRPGESSLAGFLGENESLVRVLALDNEAVHEHGLTHQEVAMPLRYIQELYRLGALEATLPNKDEQFAANGMNEIAIGDIKYKIIIHQTKGYQESPFSDEEKGSYDVTVTNVNNGNSVSFSSLLPALINRYGFYEGEETPYRVAPEKINSLFALDKEAV